MNVDLENRISWLDKRIGLSDTDKEYIRLQMIDYKTETLSVSEKVDLVKSKMLEKFPGCSHTISILLWDDDTDLVECRYGDNDIINKFTYYDNELIFTEDPMLGSITLDKFGTERVVCNNINDINKQL